MLIDVNLRMMLQVLLFSCLFMFQATDKAAFVDNRSETYYNDNLLSLKYKLTFQKGYWLVDGLQKHNCQCLRNEVDGSWLFQKH